MMYNTIEYLYKHNYSVKHDYTMTFFNCQSYIPPPLPVWVIINFFAYIGIKIYFDYKYVHAHLMGLNFILFK